MRPPQLVLGPDAPRAEWLEARRSGIGGSDIAAILGINRYKTGLHVYLDKLGDLDDTGDSAPAYWGRMLEAPVAEHWARVNGKSIAEVGMWAHRDRPWQMITVDRLVWGTTASGFPAAPVDPIGDAAFWTNDPAGHPESIYEGKTAHFMKAKEWGYDGEFVPDAYQAQCQWAMSVWDLPRVYIGCLIGGQRFVEAAIERDQELIDDLLTVGAEFWNRVVRRDPPPLEGAPVGPSLDLLKKIHGSGNGELIDVGERGLELLTAHTRAKAAASAARKALKAAEDVADEIKRDLWELLGDASGGQVDGVEVVRFANEPRAGYVVAPSSPRVLRPQKKALAEVLAARSARTEKEAA